MQDQYYSYWRDFYVKTYEWWRDVYKRTGKPEALKRMAEAKEFLYEKYLLEMDPEPAAQEAGRLLLFLKTISPWKRRQLQRYGNA